MKVILTLVLIFSGGNVQPRSIDVPSLEECWTRAEAIIAKAAHQFPQAQDADVIGIGAGCAIIPAPTQESGK